MIDERNLILTDVTAVLPDRVIDGASIVVRDGIIAEILDRRVAGDGTFDGHGSICIPGLVDTHSDALEKEIRPRPGVVLDIGFALRSFEGRARAAGVTTMFHGVGYEENGSYDRTVDQAEAICLAVDERVSTARAVIDHRILHRLDVRDADGLVALERRLDSLAEDNEEPLPLVSYEDHTPGQGQYRDRSWFERYISGTRGVDAGEAKRVVDDILASRDENLDVRQQSIVAMGARAVAGSIRLMIHDPADESEVEIAHGSGMTIAEFPTTIDAARAARARGMRTVCGGPNALRGTSHSGNVSARELISLGLCDGLASDYLPTTLIGSVGAMLSAGTCDLPTAVGLVTFGPADSVGMTDRGRIQVGSRADLVLVEFDGSLPTVRFVVSQASAMERVGLT
jgi:alpha-D-ribose 1-methylphosphonate 5-triphosphate diphosphatase